MDKIFLDNRTTSLLELISIRNEVQAWSSMFEMFKAKVDKADIDRMLRKLDTLREELNHGVELTQELEEKIIEEFKHEVDVEKKDIDYYDIVSWTIENLRKLERE